MARTILLTGRLRRRIRNLRRNGRFWSWRLRHPFRPFSEFYVAMVDSKLAAGRTHRTLGDLPKCPDTFRDSAVVELRALRERGLRPEHGCIDYGCGSLRLGRLLVEYLDAGRYCGVDVTDRYYREAFATIDDGLLARKRPTFHVLRPSARSALVARRADFVVATDVLTHVPLAGLGDFLGSLLGLLGPGAKAFVSFREGDRYEQIGRATWRYPSRRLLDELERLGARGEVVAHPEMSAILDDPSYRILEIVPGPHPRDTAASETGPPAPRLSVAMLMRRFHPLTGGYQTQSLRLGRKLRERSVDLRVVTARFAPLAPDEVHDGIPIHRVPIVGRRHVSAASYLVSSLAWMARHRGRFRIVHANRISSGLVAGLVGLLLKKKVLCRPTRGEEVHALGVGAGGRLKLWFLRRTVDRFVAITDAIAADLRALGIPADRIVRIDNGIDLAPPSADDRAAVHASLGWHAPVTVVTYVGRLVRAKGVDWLLDAWERVREGDGCAKLLVVGEGPERADLEARARQLGIADSVVFLGSRDDVPRLLAASDVFVLPSRLEGSSNALLEAMSQRLPAVVGDDALGGNRELVTDGVEGYVVPLEDACALGDRIVALVRDPAARVAMGERARRRVERERSLERITDRYCELYASMVDEPPAPPAPVASGGRRPPNAEARTPLGSPGGLG